MKKLVLTFVALVAVATTSFAQYFTTYKPCPSVTYNVPSVTYTVPKVTYSVPSTVNYNTTTVSGYTRSNGTYVQPHVRTMPNSTNWDNYSTKGNYNPITGSTGNTIITATDIKHTYLNVICGSYEKADGSNGQEQK